MAKKKVTKAVVKKGAKKTVKKAVAKSSKKGPKKAAPPKAKKKTVKKAVHKKTARKTVKKSAPKRIVKKTLPRAKAPKAGKAITSPAGAQQASRPAVSAAVAAGKGATPDAGRAPVSPVAVTVQWNEGFSVGVQSLDNQHKKLFDMINTLHTAIHENKPREVTGHVLEELWDYVESHFEEEEILMEKYRYGEYKQHKQAHNELDLRLNEIYNRFELGDAVISEELSAFLLKWLKEHILGIDKRYSAFMAANGIE